MMLDPYIRIRGGQQYFILRPTADMIDIEHIAYALSNVNRFTGHVGPYSVAEHSLYVSEYVEPQNALWGLLHDASEAYLGDVSSPLKQLLPDYKRLEELSMLAIADKFGLHWPMPTDVHVVDMRLANAEIRDLLGCDPAMDFITAPPIPETIPRREQADPKHIERLFLRRFAELTRASEN